VIENSGIKRKKIILTWIVFICSCSITVYSQLAYNIEGSYFFGSNINKKSDREFGETTPNGIELSFKKTRNGNNYWEKSYNYPQIGWSLKWFDHKNKYLGHSFCLNRYVNLILWRNNHFDFYFKLSQGIMYASKIYKSGDKFNKRYNNAVGQRLNFSTELGLGINIYPTEKIGISCESFLTHFSNGAMSQPNDGMNLLMIKLGLIYMLEGRNSIVYIKPEKKEFDKKIRFNINISGGVKQINSESEKKHLLITISPYFDKKLSHISSINIGADLFMNTAEKYRIDNNINLAGTDFKRIGISIGHELSVGPTGILTQIGYHVYSPYPAISRFYQKYGMKYYISNKIFTSFSVRIFNLEVSDETTFGIGVRL
jgi:hypothetical protein